MRTADSVVDPKPAIRPSGDLRPIGPILVRFVAQLRRRAALVEEQRRQQARLDRSAT